MDYLSLDWKSLVRFIKARWKNAHVSYATPQLTESKIYLCSSYICKDFLISTLFYISVKSEQSFKCYFSSKIFKRLHTLLNIISYQDLSGGSTLDPQSTGGQRLPVILFYWKTRCLANVCLILKQNCTSKACFCSETQLPLCFVFKQKMWF